MKQQFPSQPIPRERYGCPNCGETKNLSPNPGLRREQDGKTIEGHICNCCGMAFVDHPDLKRQSIGGSRLMLGDHQFAVMRQTSPGRRPGILRPPAPEAHRGDGQWLKPRDSGPSFDVKK